MSIQNGLLAVLTTGPAYGSQLQAELMVRAPHRARLNAGQVYATLERCLNKGFIVSAGSTDDGLPLYELTATGESAVRDWLVPAAPLRRPEWDEMLDQVLVSASLELGRPLAVIDRYREAWTARLAATTDDDSAANASAERASDLITEAALGWLDEMRLRLVSAPDSLRVARSVSRPRRGRPAAIPLGAPAP